jgi:hypothetical protein
MNITPQETAKLQTYLQATFGNKNITLRVRPKAEDSVEVLLGGEFIGTIYKDTEDGDTSYDFNMVILDIDLSAAA